MKMIKLTKTEIQALLKEKEARDVLYEVLTSIEERRRKLDPSKFQSKKRKKD